MRLRRSSVSGPGLQRKRRGRGFSYLDHASAREPTSKTARRREEAAVMRAVAEQLGNTPAVARRSYVDPRVVAAYTQGLTIAPALKKLHRQKSPED